ncbi:tripartite motif-containing protein 16-like [Polypterus senegalus]|uniref:tripartite motif-containing protein 16-like n=1 Tax=Polypterus senegalus TaxID=55291 RepID=UPI0019643817|nr:tripartite motif-containing protein 16-like [Polypterus senegalus]
MTRTPSGIVSGDIVSVIEVHEDDQSDNKRTLTGCEAPVFTLQTPELQNRDDFLKYFRSLTLDINTANRVLHLSEGNKKVTREWTKAEYPDHPDRFDYCVQVLCSEALIGTRCYWEVECSGKSLRIGVAYKGLSRKAWGRECSLGNNDKSWSLQWSHSQYSVHNNNNTTAISAPYSPRIGVYLDWPAGSLSFYSVSHTMTLLHRFKIFFTEPLYPGFLLYDYSSMSERIFPADKPSNPSGASGWTGVSGS